MVDEGTKLLVMEVSSHSLKLRRVDDVDFDVAVFTNLGTTTSTSTATSRTMRAARPFSSRTS